MESQPSISLSPQLGIRRVRAEEWNPRIQAALRSLSVLLHIYSHVTYHRYDILTLPKFCIWMKQQLLVGPQDCYYEELLPHREKYLQIHSYLILNCIKTMKLTRLILFFYLSAWPPCHYSLPLQKMSVFMKLGDFKTSYWS